MGAMKDWMLSMRERENQRGTQIHLAEHRPLNWNDVEAVTGGQLGTFNLPCPYCGPEKRSSTRFRLERESVGRARWHCFYCAEHGSLDSGEPVDPQLEAAARSIAIAKRTEEQAEKVARALKLWDEAVPLKGTLAAEYLAARAIHDLPERVDDVLRFHPASPLGLDGLRPCMVALMRDARTNEPRAVHRTWVSSSGKARGRMALGSIAGAAVKLWPAESGTLVVGEGIETSLAAGLYLNRANGDPLRPAWALTVASNIEYLPVLPFRELVILVDNDLSGTGQRVAAECARRWTAKGRLVTKLMPKEVGTDFNDVVRARAAR